MRCQQRRQARPSARAQTRLSHLPRRPAALGTNIVAQDSVGLLPVYCRFGLRETQDGEWETDPEGCPAQFPAGTAPEHEAACGFELLRCAFAGCGAEFRRSGKDAHDLAEAQRHAQGEAQLALERRQAETVHTEAAQALYEAAERVLVACVPEELQGGEFDAIISAAASSAAASFTLSMMRHLFPGPNVCGSIRFNSGTTAGYPILYCGVRVNVRVDSAQRLQNNATAALIECVRELHPASWSGSAAAWVVTSANSSAAFFAVTMMSCYKSPDEA